MRRILSAIACLLLVVPIAGSAPRAPAGPPLPLLWKVSDADNRVYLLGSFHLLRKDDYPLSPDVDAAFADAEALVFEIPPSELADPSLPLRMMQLATSDPDASLARVLPPDMLERLHARIHALGLPSAQLDHLEPWFVDATLVSVLGQRLGYSSDDGLDRALMVRAAEAGKPVSGLETLDDQLAALDGSPITEQLASLRDFVEEGEGMDRQLDELHAAWRTADIPTLERLTREQMIEKTPVTYRRLNVERNEAWLPKIEALVAKGPGEDALVVVGALHLLGEDGLVARLRERGYRVERICSACTGTGD